MGKENMTKEVHRAVELETREMRIKMNTIIKYPSFSGRKTGSHSLPVRQTIVAVMLFVTFGLGYGAVTTNYVDNSRPDDSGDGTSWATAKKTIQAAINITADQGDTVWVTNGTYTLTNQITITNAITLQSVNGTNFTFINGNYPNTTNRCIYVNSNDSIIDGFTISNGFSTSGSIDGGGGVMLYYKGTLRNCIIQGNICSNIVSYSGGGGVFLYRGGVITNCVIVSNTVVDNGGGGISTYNGGIIRNSRIMGNTAALNSGGVCLYSDASSPESVITNCLVYGNMAITDQGGGLTASFKSRIVNCTIYNNIATNYDHGQGGGVFVFAGGSISDSVISNNIAAIIGGGIFINYGGSVTNCVITGNSCTYSGGWGGGMCLYGNSGFYTVDKCVIYANQTPGAGGGALLYGRHSEELSDLQQYQFIN